VAGRYSVGVNTPAAAAGAAYATIHTAAGARARIQEIHAFTQAATASRIAVGRKNNTPVASTSVLGQAEDPADAAAVTNVDTAWSTAPTAPANFLRRGSLANLIGAGVMWVWTPGKELIIPVSDWLIIWNDGAAAGSILSLTIVWEE
jgi:hypothetical protein